jgi:hypothetical protein
VFQSKQERRCRLESNSGKKKKVSKPKSKKNQKALLLGVGLDSQDGHVRVTSGPNFKLVGGSKDTHEVMQETAVKFNEELSKRGKHLTELEPKEFFDIMHKLN